MHYAVSDIHGEYDQFMDVLEKAGFSDEDTLYVLGDVLDRGKHPVKCIEYMMERNNIIPIMGDHEYMFLNGIELLKSELINDSHLDEITDDRYELLIAWINNGYGTTMNTFSKLHEERQGQIIRYIESFRRYVTVDISPLESPGIMETYLLSHAAPSVYKRGRDPSDTEELLWGMNYGEVTEDMSGLIHGHIPTQNLKSIEGSRCGYISQIGSIYRKNFMIDCGACYDGGRLGLLCLETKREFYSRN